ncbi:MAG TPA: PQQ-dependent sugar dehydrogenase [Nitrososphaeraceae archaeon]|nr:PQQ-dependent sugar dehydrogenase [Nitrososphaeraceae archaeon]
MLLIVLIATIILSTLTFYGPVIQTAYAQPTINDPNLNAEAVVAGLTFPTSMAFLDENNILILEKEGSVRLVSNGVLQDTPVLQIPVNSQNERGLLGVEVVNDSTITAGTAPNGVSLQSTVFLYFTEEGEGEDGELRNRVYKYQWNGQSLVNPTLILDLPAGPGTNHQGGKLIVGPDGYLYVVIGELQREGQLQNIQSGPNPDDSGVIFRVNPQDGSAAGDNPFQGDPLNRYFAYGVRNSFGMAFDPITGILWDTENGEESYDEINIVNPGFNSGWKAVMGPISAAGISENDLVQFPGSNYADPVFSWLESFGITDIEFLNSQELGQRYANNIFVGDITQGNLYFFEVNESRNGLNFNTQTHPGLSDLVADTDDESSSIMLGTGFTGITDIETGPDGFLYVLTHDRETGDGNLYRIVLGASGAPDTTTPPIIEETLQEEEEEDEEQD